MNKTAIIGKTSFIGNALYKEYRKEYPDCVATTRRTKIGDLDYLDLLNPDIVPLRLAEFGYTDAVICAAITGLKVCEDDKEYTKKMTDGTLQLIEQLAGEGIKPIYLSSDTVFDGKKGGYDDEAPLNPINEYGKQKAAIEQRMKEICKENYLIVRLTKVFALSHGDGTIFDDMASVLTSGRTIRAAYDQIFSITLLSDVINAIKLLQKNNVTGVVNVSSPEVWSRYDLAVKMADYLGINSERVKRISLDDLEEPFLRPKNTSLVTRRLDQESNYEFASIEQCILSVAGMWRKNESYSAQVDR